MVSDEGELERFEPGSETDLSAFPRLVANAFASWPVVSFQIQTGKERDHLPVLVLSLRFAEGEQIVVSMRGGLARNLQSAIGQMLEELSPEP